MKLGVVSKEMFMTGVARYHSIDDILFASVYYMVIEY